MPQWLELNRSLREAGLIVSDARLHSVAAATTVRVRGGAVELTDGPFATTKEVLAGYYLLRCADLDEAVRQAARMPLARYGSVEVRPVADPGPPPDRMDAGTVGSGRPSGGAAAAT